MQGDQASPASSLDLTDPTLQGAAIALLVVLALATPEFRAWLVRWLQRLSDALGGKKHRKGVPREIDGGAVPQVGCDYGRAPRQGEFSLWEEVRSPLFPVHHSASQYPASSGNRYLDMLQRVSDYNYTMYAMIRSGTSARYTWAKRNCFWERHFSVGGSASRGGSRPQALIDTVHMDGSDPRDGTSLVTAHSLLARAGPHVEAVFLFRCSEVTEDDLIQLVSLCPSLGCLAICQCNISDRLLLSLATSCPLLQGLRVNCVTGQLTDTGLTAILQTCNQLQWLDIGDAGEGTEFSTLSWQMVGLCPQLRVLRLPGNVTVDDLALLSPLRHLEVLHLASRAALPLNALVPLATAPLKDVDGFVLCDNLSDHTCAMDSAVGPIVNRLHIQTIPAAIKDMAASFVAVKELVLQLGAAVTGSQMAALVGSPMVNTLQALRLGMRGTHPSVISQCCLFNQLAFLDLSGCFRNEYDIDECPEPSIDDFDDLDDMQYWQGMGHLEANGEALQNVCHGLKNLVQLDLSTHFDCFYSCIDPHDLTDALSRCFKLQRLNLRENGRKYPWIQVKHALDGHFTTLAEDGELDCDVTWPEDMGNSGHHNHYNNEDY